MGMWQIPPTKRGYQYAEVISALQKCIRRCDVDQSVYWATELEVSGYGRAAWHRLIAVLSEDVGPAEPDMPQRIAALFDLWRYMVDVQKKKGGESRMLLTQAVILLAECKKSRMVESAINYHVWRANRGERLYDIPDVALDKHTLRGKRMGRGIEHFIYEGCKIENEHLPNPWKELGDMTDLDKYGVKKVPLAEGATGASPEPDPDESPDEPQPELPKPKVTKTAKPKGPSVTAGNLL